METAMARATEFAAKSSRPSDARGIELAPISREIDGDTIVYKTLSASIDRDLHTAEITVTAPEKAPAQDIDGIISEGCDFWPLAFARDFDDFILHMRANEIETSTWVFKTVGDADNVEAGDAALLNNADHWLVREITLYLKRTLKRLDVSSRSIVTLVEPGSCYTGTLLELVLAADRSYMLDGVLEGSNLPEATIRPTGINFGPLPMCNGLSRLETRYLDDASQMDNLQAEIGRDLNAETADELGLVTFIPDDIDWEDEVRIAIEERASYSPDALTGMEASLRFAGPETLETKIFGRLSAWQNWIFQRPNAVGEEGALQLFGTGKQAKYDRKRV